CHGGNGSVLVSASGGTPPYSGTASFSQVAGNYSFTVTDAHGCSAVANAPVAEPAALLVSAVATDAACHGGNGSVLVSASGGTPPYSGTASFSQVAGNYSFTVTDAHGCSAVASATVGEPAALLVSAVATDAACHGGNGRAPGREWGGTPPYSGTGNLRQVAGNYSFTVTDAHGCSGVTSATVGGPAALLVSAVATDAACHGGNGAVLVSASGGTPPYSGTGNFSQAAWSYSFTVTDAHGCSAVANATVGEPAALLVSAVVTDAACHGGNGSVLVSASGGTPPYSGTGSFSKATGTYSFTVTDAHGCSATASATVGQPAELQVSAVATDAACHGGNGSVLVSASGGTPPYSGTASFSQAAGSYSFTVTDAPGCSAVASATVGEPAALLAS